jgi:hypothetical protein
MATKLLCPILGAVALTSVLTALAAPPAKPDVTKQKVVGEWSLKSSAESPDKIEVVWTFRDSGIVRIDAIDQKSGDQVRVLVGQWRLENQDILLVEESWNQARQRPWQVEERLHVRELAEGAMSVQVIYAPPHQLEEGRTLEFKRFAGWGKPR